MRFFFTKKPLYHQGFFAVKRRAVFILGAMWWALVRGWRKDCVVGGMETRFQCRKAHNPSAKCEAFHIAPRLFFMFLFFYSIDDSATKHNLSPQIFHRSKKAQPIILIIQIQLFGQKKGGCLKKQPPNFIFGQKFFWRSWDLEVNYFTSAPITLYFLSPAMM